MKKIIVCSVALLMAVGINAEDIRLDFGDAGGAAGGNWNVATDPSSLGLSNLTDYNSGTLTGVDVSWDFTSELLATLIWDTKDWAISEAGSEFFFSESDAVVTFSGLLNPSYQVEVLIAYEGSLTSGYQIDSALADRTYLGNPVDNPWNWRDDGATPGDWMIWDAVTPSSGNISIDIAKDTYAAASAIRITAVPEPATAMLLAIGGGIAWLVRMKQRL